MSSMLFLSRLRLLNWIAERDEPGARATATCRRSRHLQRAICVTTALRTSLAAQATVAATSVARNQRVYTQYSAILERAARAHARAHAAHGTSCVQRA